MSLQISTKDIPKLSGSMAQGIGEKGNEMIDA